MPLATEQFKWGRPVYALKKDFCYLQKNKNYINFGIMNFGAISDEKNLLQGTGKSMRHIKIHSLDEIDKNYIAKILKQLTAS